MQFTVRSTPKKKAREIKGRKLIQKVKRMSVLTRPPFQK